MENGVELSPALEFHEGSEVWIPIRAHEAQKADSNSLSSSVTNWVSGQVAEVTCNASGEHILTVSTDDNGLSEAKACDCVLRNPTDDMDDLVRSDYLHEPGILETIGVRFAKDTIYTYSGNILIAVNPFKRLRGLYGRLTMSYYRGKQLGEYGPHVYAVAEAAHSAMMMDQQRQAILISGESGAGKTETAKLVMQYLAHRNASPTIAEWQESSSRSKMQNHIEEQVLESNPLLEAFGNAKTSRNDNSSRFGKFVDIDFDEMGNIGGAQICTYLLERSRVVSVASPERSYHIFYQLCAGANDSFKQRWRLGGGAESFRYLAQSSTIVLEGVDDAAAFSQTCEAMRIVGIPSDQQEAALQLIAAILHMGNICFADNDADQAQLAGRDAEAALAVVAELLMLPQEELLHSLTTRTIQVAGCAIQKPLTAAQAAASRDALSKTIYARLFDWLVRNINWKLRGSRPWTDSGSRRIGILDIYGFESFEINSFEQLCINLANEKLQQQFNLHVFKHEQAQYEEEGIDWSFISFQDNQDCVEVLEGAHGSVFSLLDEACRLANTTAADLARSLRSTLSEHPRFKAPKLQQGSFIIQHYAGQVQYGCSGLIEKNKDFVVLEHENVAAASQLPLLQELFAGAGPPPTGTAGADSVRGRKSGYKLATIAQRFRTQLTTLMAALGSCNPHYIRCIKPNPCSEPTVIDKASILDQLRAGGVLEAVRVASAGFPTKKVLGPFAVRYAHLLRGCHVQAALQAPLAPPERQQQLARSILQHVQGVLGPDAFSGWQIGRSRVFLLSGQLAMLEGLLRQRQQAAGVCIQAAWRGWCVRRWLRQLRRSAVAIQAAWRGFVAWRRRQRLLEELSASRIQAAWRRHKLEKDAELRRRHDAATVIQKTVRMHLVRMWYRKETQAGRQAALRACQWEAARKLQRCVRRYQARARARAWRREAVRVRELERQVEELGEAAERWEQWCNEAQCRVTQLQAVNVRLQQELLAANALASAAEAKAASAEADAKEHRHAAKKAVQKALEQAQKEAEAAQEAAHHARLAMQQAEERAREESARRLELAEEHAREEAARQLEVAEERAQVEAARQLQKAEERAREQAARQLQLAEERAREEAARQLQMAEERARQESARQLERSQRELAEAQQSVVEALQGELKMAKVARAEAQQQVSQLRARLEAERAEFEAKQEGLEREKRRAAQAQSRLQKSQDISYSLEKRLKAEADGLRARNRKLASDNAAIRSRLESRIYELEHAKAPPNHTGIPRPVHSRASSTTGGTGSEAQSARTRSLEQERDMLREQVDDLRRQVVVLERHASAQGAAGMKRFGSLDRSRVPAGTGLRRQQPSNIPAFVAGTGAAVAARAGRPSCEVGAESSSTDSSGHGGTASPQTAVVKAEAAKVMDTLQVLIQAVMSEPLPLVVLAHTGRSFPHAAYLLGRGAAQLCGSWDAAGVRFQAVGALKAVLLTAVQQEVGLSRRLYWLGMALASAGMLNVYGQVLQKKLLLDLAQDLAFHDRVHRSVGAVVQQQLHVGPELAIAVGSHLSATPRRAAARKVAGGGEPTSMGRKSVSGAWSELRGQLKNVLDTVRSAGLSPAAERGCVRLVLQLLDANLVNLLMLNRNACSRSSVGSTQRHMGELMRWLVTESGSWGGDKSDIEWGFRRVVQALRYLGGGKEELSRKVRSGIDVQVECSRRCKDLTLAQVYRLTQHHWDDWVAREQQTQGETWGLLEALRRAEYSASTQQAEPAAAAGRNGDAAAAVKVPKDWLNRSTEEGELLIDAVQEFVLDQRVAGASANHYVGVGSREASSVTVQQAAHQVQRACGLLPVPAALQHAESELAMLHPHPQAGDRSPPGPGQPIMNAAGA